MARPGFTLVELLVAVMLLGVVLVGMAMGILGTASMQNQVGSRREMTEIADSKFEDLRAFALAGSPDTVQLALGGSLTASAADHADSVQSAHGRWFRRRWAVATGPAGAREVQLRVTPRDQARGTLARLDFTTFILIVP